MPKKRIRSTRKAFLKLDKTDTSSQDTPRSSSLTSTTCITVGQSRMSSKSMIRGILSWEVAVEVGARMLQKSVGRMILIGLIDGTTRAVCGYSAVYHIVYLLLSSRSSGTANLRRRVPEPHLVCISSCMYRIVCPSLSRYSSCSIPCADAHSFSLLLRCIRDFDFEVLRVLQRLSADLGASRVSCDYPCMITTARTAPSWAGSSGINSIPTTVTEMADSPSIQICTGTPRGKQASSATCPPHASSSASGDQFSPY